MPVERRPHMQRNCLYPGCDWKQTTSWFMGSPHFTRRVPDKALELELTAHMKDVHGVRDVGRKIFT